CTCGPASSASDPASIRSGRTTCRTRSTRCRRRRAQAARTGPESPSFLQPPLWVLRASRVLVSRSPSLLLRTPFPHLCPAAAGLFRKSPVVSNVLSELALIPAELELFQ